MLSGNPLPKLGLLHHRNYPRATDLKGTDRYGKLAPGLTFVDFEEAMTHRWPTDCHVVSYWINDLGDQSFPTIRKALLPQLLEVGVGVVVTSIFIDLDTPGHAPLTKGNYQKFQQSLLCAYEKGLEVALDWTAFYSTKAGVRLVYVLSEPVHPEVAEGIHKGLVRDFWAAGVKVDDGCSDWTHVFRLPNVVREGLALWKLETAEIILQLEKRLDPDSITPMFESLGGLQSTPKDFVDPKPIPEESEALLWMESDKGRRAMTEWQKLAKRRLKGRECFPCIWDSAPLADVGSRNSTLQRHIGQAISLLIKAQGTTPATIYALFYESVLGLEPDSGDPDWTDTLWRQVGYCWTHEEAKLEAEASSLEPHREKLEVMVEKVREWCDDPALRGELAEAREWVLGHLIADTGKSLHIMKETGRYDSLYISIRQLASRIRELEMEDVIPLWIPNKDSTGVKPRSHQSILDAHSTAVSIVEGRVGDFGGMIREIGTERSRLVISLYKRRTDLKPEFNEHIDIWLRLLGGKDYEKLCLWIGHALAFEDGPICALSLSGAPGIGKKLLVQGLAECIDTETVAAMEKMDQFHTLLMYTPFVVINEGISDNPRAARDIADTFRHYTSGDPIEVNQKFRPPIFIRSPLRLIFTANNVDTLAILTAHRDLSPEDREALAIRLFHVETNNDAALWLTRQGGLDFTRGWIYGDSGNPSRYVVAKHFLWLYERRTVPALGQRLLVEGELTESIERMTTSSGSAPSVIETLIKMIEFPSVQQDGLKAGQGEVWVTSSAIVEHFRNDIGAKTNQSINHRQVSRVLRGLALKEHSQPISLPLKGGRKKRARWHEIDAARLMGQAVEHGYPHNNLRKILDYQELEGIGEHEQQGAHTFSNPS